MTAVNLNRAIRGPVTAVPVVAGKGVRLVADTVNNRFVVEADETVLWEGTPTTVTDDIPLNENPSNFEYVDVFARWTYNTDEHINCFVRLFGNESKFSMNGIGVYNPSNTSVYDMWYVVGDYALTSTKISVIRAFRVSSTGSDTSSSDTLKSLKVVGINHIASN